MTYLILGLALFAAPHLFSLLLPAARSAMRQKIGEGAYKGAYTFLSFAGLALIVWGFGQVRQMPVQLWSTPEGLRHLAAVINLAAFVLLAAAYVPGNRIKARVHHPMVLGVALCAIAHLLPNSNLGQVVLFGSFLLWSVLDGWAATQRDRRLGTVDPNGTTSATITTAIDPAAPDTMPGRPPNSAVSVQIIKAPYRPISGLRWATSANAMHSGSRAKDVVSPARTSARRRESFMVYLKFGTGETEGVTSNRW